MANISSMTFPLRAFWGLKYVAISHLYSEFLAACATGMLPQVSYVDPRFIDEASVVSHADHLLLRAVRARVTFSRMSVAFAVQMKGLDF
jgi:hypothetical protein